MLELFLGAVFLIGVADGAEKGAVKFVKYYEHLSYDSVAIQEQHDRVKRSAQSGESAGHLLLNFQSHGRHFNIRLVRDTSLFHKDFQLVNGNGDPVDTDVSHIYHGNIWGKPKSLVHGSIIDGVFTGVIRDPDHGTYYIEHSEHFFKGEPIKAAESSHSVMYHEKEIDFPHKYGSQKSCGSSFSDIEKRMADFQKSASVQDDKVGHIRKKRALDKHKNTCYMFVQTDHMLWAELKSRDKIVAKISDHIKVLNYIFSGTTFFTSDNTPIRNLAFKVKRLKIDETKEPDDKFYSNQIGVEKFLDLASTANHNDFCLAYVFTQRDFSDGVLGLAWVGGKEEGSAGVCARFRQYAGKPGKSLNTGIVTFKNFDASVPSKVSHITFAHEVGHNFGSPHDSGQQCTPAQSGYSTLGNYIMFASATSGSNENNNIFSPCSIGNMSLVLEAKKDVCFEKSDVPICGNGIINDNEECDCGYAEECTEIGDINCCYPADDKVNGCKLKSSAQCSVSQGPCCEKGTCRFEGKSVQCSSESDCRKAQTCNGDSAQCPPAAAKPNSTTECNYGTQVCWDGECTGSICEKGNMKGCSCAVPESGDKTIACHVCCEGVNMSGEKECKSIGDSDYSHHFNRTAILLQPGSPCNNLKGYCDVFSHCRNVDADGPLSRIKQAIVNPDLYKTIKDWIIEYWWAVALMCLALILLMAGFMKLCIVHTPSSNPSLPKERRLPGPPRAGRSKGARQRRQNDQKMNDMRRR